MKNIIGFLAVAITLTTSAWAEEIKSVDILYGYKELGFYSVCPASGHRISTLEESTQTFMKRNKTDGTMYIVNQGAGELGFEFSQDVYNVFILNGTQQDRCWFEITDVHYQGGSAYYSGKIKVISEK